MRRLLTIFAFAATFTAVMAVPARRGITRTVSLADGTRVQVELRGDETFHFYVNSATGEALTEQADGTWSIDSRDVKTLWTKKSAQRNAHRERLAMKTRKLMSTMIEERRKAPMKIGSSTAGTGSKKGLLILVNFSGTNEKMVNGDQSRDIFDQMLNGINNPYGKNYGSVREYFRSQSYGLFDIEFDVVGPVTVSQNMTYYGRDYSSDQDKYCYKMIEEACTLVDSQIDFSDYDWDGDGEVENIYVTYAGYGQAAGAPSNTIWPHQWSISAAHYYYGTEQDHTNYTFKLDNVIIDTYACGSELDGASGSTLSGIGTMCHEYSHCLGLPDFYDTAGSNFGMDSWSLMDYGCYNGNGFHPSGYTAYERWFSGWLEPKELKSPYFVGSLKPIEDEPDAYIVYNDKNRNEYYLLANHQLKGWDKKAYGHGMMVNHVYYQPSKWTGNTVNNTASQQCMTLIPADNSLSGSSLSGDLYPNGGKNNSLTNTSTPAAKLYVANTDGKYLMNKPITDISETDGDISFSFMGGSVALDSPVATNATGITATAFTANWEPVEGAVSYNLSLTETTDDGVESPDAVESMVLYEDFAKFLADTEGAVDLSSQLDNYTFVPGWSGQKVFQGKYGAKMASGKAAGSLTTPAMDFATETMTIITYVRSYENDGTTPTLNILDGSGNTIASGTITPSDDSYLIFYLDSDVPSTAKLQFTASKGKRFYVGDLYVFDAVLDDDQINQFIEEELSSGNSAPQSFAVQELKPTLSFTTKVLPRRTTLNKAPRKAKIVTEKRIDNIAATSYTLTDCVPSSVYTYKVQAVDAEGNVSLWSNTITLTTLDEEQNQMGDVNLDGILSIADVTALVNFILKGNTTSDDDEGGQRSAASQAVADVNGDGVITIADVTALVNIILGKTE